MTGHAGSTPSPGGTEDGARKTDGSRGFDITEVRYRTGTPAIAPDRIISEGRMEQALRRPRGA